MDVENSSTAPKVSTSSSNQTPEVAVDPVTGEVIPNINTYQQKKNLALGMMDLALVSANANQLRYVIESFARHPYYYFSIIFISISLVIQIAVGVGLVMNSRYDVNNRRETCKANRINNFVTIGIFLITLINVIISAFGVAPQVD
ncbi:ninjurin-A [Aedes albopictus]|uniref:Ninjurin a n=1 Tax=Aedes albopictus TaxID=7160 RepID=A0ABM1ZM19_AEDAL|nr:ninjurin-1-like [Aedes albopictus]XP_029725103.1 ninjurin-1-like [Aedes albopictus]